MKTDDVRVLKFWVFTSSVFFFSTYLASFQLLNASDNESCMACHAPGADVGPAVNLDHYSKSVHAAFSCTDCHQDASDVPHPEKLAKVSCSLCHEDQVKAFRTSPHGKVLSEKKSDGAACALCHGDSHFVFSSSDPKSPVFDKNIPDTCATCHAKAGLTDKRMFSQQEPLDTYLHTVHGEALRAGNEKAAECSDCHGSHAIAPAKDPKSKIFKANISETCGSCHKDIKAEFNASVHGKAMQDGVREAPVCTDCHGEHTIRPIRDPESSVYAAAVTKTCSGCHASEKIVGKFGLPVDRLTSYQDSYHGLAQKLGDVKAANCASCHGWHKVLPSSDPESMVHPQRLANTCGSCHPGLGQGASIGKIHSMEVKDKHAWVQFFTLFYWILIPLLIGGMLIHNFTDYIRKLWFGRDKLMPHEEKEHHIERLNTSERVQHAVLMISFTVLAYSGFALKFSDGWWAAPFQWLGEGARKGLHRWTALLFSVMAVWHVIYMVFTRRGRFLLRVRLAPRWRDCVQPFQLMAYNLGLRKTKPVLIYPSYIEKLEYWALVWGSVVMMLTGALLVFNSFVLKHFGVWVTDLATVVHYYEAILATLAILVWHFYWAVFDPHVYPMNLSWLIGTLKHKRHKKDEGKKHG